jgi:hypothetical protein
MLADTNRRIPKIATFKYRLFPVDTKDQFLRIRKCAALGSRHVGPRSELIAIDVVPPWWRPWPPWSKPPAATQISEAARCRRTRLDRRHAVAAVLEAAHRQSDLRGRPLPPRETRSPWSKSPAAPWLLVRGLWGRERGAVTALVLIVVAVPIALVNDHLLLLEHDPLWVGDGSHGGTTAVATTGTTGTTSRCALRRPCPRPYRAIALSHASHAVVPQLLEEEREREKRG